MGDDHSSFNAFYRCHDRSFYADRLREASDRSGEGHLLQAEKQSGYLLADGLMVVCGKSKKQANTLKKYHGYGTMLPKRQCWASNSC